MCLLSVRFSKVLYYIGVLFPSYGGVELMPAAWITCRVAFGNYSFAMVEYGTSTWYMVLRLQHVRYTFHPSAGSRRRHAAPVHPARTCHMAASRISSSTTIVLLPEHVHVEAINYSPTVSPTRIASWPWRDVLLLLPCGPAPPRGFCETFFFSFPSLYKYGRTFWEFRTKRVFAPQRVVRVGTRAHAVVRG